jgi:hypothetical protein
MTKLHVSFCQPKVLDLSICWACNFDYVVKGGESVTTGNVRLRNKQIRSIFVSYGSTNKNAFAVHFLIFSFFFHLDIISHH